jgi:hypothetical protein
MPCISYVWTTISLDKPMLSCATLEQLLYVRQGVGCHMTSVNIPGLLTVADAATELSRSTEQVRRYLREGRLRGRRLGGQWFIEEGALTSFREALNDQSSYLDKLRPANQLQALDAVIGIGHGGGSNIAEGKDSYRRSSWWRR